MRKKVLSILFGIIAISISSYGQNQANVDPNQWTEWTVDPYHSSLNFTIKHSGISMVNGKFTDYTGKLLTRTGKKSIDENLESAQFDFTIQANSINTNVEPRDNHLRSADFFEVETYPTLSFKSTKIIKSGKPGHYILHGKLTIKDVTKDVILDLYHGGTVESDDGNKIGFKAKTVINRFDYNVNYDPTAAGIGKDVHLEIHLQFGTK